MIFDFELSDKPLNEANLKGETMYDIYYAHHQWKYGTKIEEYEISLIKRYFPHASIFNPSTDLNTKGMPEPAIMEECLK